LINAQTSIRLLYGLEFERRNSINCERYLSVEEIVRLKTVLDEKMYRKAGKGINQTFFHLRFIVLTALTTGSADSRDFPAQMECARV